MPAPSVRADRTCTMTDIGVFKCARGVCLVSEKEHPHEAQWYMVRCSPSLMVYVLYPSTFLPPQSAQRICVNAMLTPLTKRMCLGGRILTLYSRNVQTY